MSGQPASPAGPGSPTAAASTPSTAIQPALDNSAPIEADDAATASDGASIDEQLSSYSQSLASSVVDYPVEYGRRFHAFRRGTYVMPNDELEMERLDIAHAMIVKAIGNRLFLAPLEKDKVHDILDIGTGTGIWAIEMADVFPNAEILGNDLSAIQPPWLPPNVRFEVDDVESPWVENRKYDYIFVRHMLLAIADWPQLVKNVFDHLKPGGWAEFQDMDGLFYSEDGSFTEDHHTWKWIHQIVETAESMGRTARPGLGLRGWVENAGFQNITHQAFKIPLGPWPKEPRFRDIGMLNLWQTLDGLEGFSFKLFCDFNDWTKEEVLVLTSKVRNELKTNAFHVVWNHHVVYAQKPETSEGDTN